MPFIQLVNAFGSVLYPLARQHADVIVEGRFLDFDCLKKGLSGGSSYDSCFFHIQHVGPCTELFYAVLSTSFMLLLNFIQNVFNFSQLTQIAEFIFRTAWFFLGDSVPTIITLTNSRCLVRRFQEIF